MKAIPTQEFTSSKNRLFVRLVYLLWSQHAATVMERMRGMHSHRNVSLNRSNLFCELGFAEGEPDKAVDAARLSGPGGHLKRLPRVLGHLASVAAGENDVAWAGK